MWWSNRSSTILWNLENPHELVISSWTVLCWFRHHFDNKHRSNEKTTFRDLTYAVLDKKIIDYLSGLSHIKLQTGKIFDENAVISCLENGDRYVYADSGIIPSILTTADIDGQPCCIITKVKTTVVWDVTDPTIISKTQNSPPAFTNNSLTITYNNSLIIITFKNLTCIHAA